MTCFLCKKSLDGWEEGDDALREHLKHAGDCGWAILAAIEGGDEELKNEDPMSERMRQARKDTFGEFWPHDGKKGWTAKSRQVTRINFLLITLNLLRISRWPIPVGNTPLRLSPTIWQHVSIVHYL